LPVYGDPRFWQRATVSGRTETACEFPRPAVGGAPPRGGARAWQYL